jgi:hypothetical protein
MLHLPFLITLYCSAREVNKNTDTACFYLVLACMIALLYLLQCKQVSWILVAPLLLWYLSKPVQKASKLFIESR